ncbi:glycoside hydrolase 43 family protein [uncultured Sphingomonas sp.]|uniref:glycoside hydrolase family 43 protein n=1 Tax=uncultured Sphingomonas sp. TaxID=158754 RepID=UPI0025D38A08|nr:glycoside hydrolase 43 family protein [uncultured Sphingomonas sp.]
MRVPLLAIAAAALSVQATAAPAPATYRNPVLFADYSDPDVVRVGSDYYLIASSFHFSPGIPVLHSRDLVHWSIVGHVLPKLPFARDYDMPGPHLLTDATTKPIGGTKYASGVWAPSIRHHDGLFYVYWPTPDEGIFMATAEDPAGPWSKPVQVIAQAGLEDPCPFWDDDGQAWLVHSKLGAGPLILHRMSPDGTRILDDGVLIAEDKINLPVLEGPKLYKRNGWYYIFAPIGGVGTGPQAVGRARRIDGPYEWRTVLEPGTTPIQGPHQGGWVETPSGESWFLHFNQTGAFGRIVHLQPMQWRDDWPIIGSPIPDRSAGQPVLTHAVPATGSVPTTDQLQASDTFASPRLGLQWSWNHNPHDTAWSLRARPGWLRLNALPAQYLVTARNTLTQVLQGPASIVTAHFDTSRMADGQRAGLSLFGARPSWIGIVRSGGVSRVTFASEGVETAGPALRNAVIELRADIGEDQVVRYAYRADGGRRFIPLGPPTWLARFSWWKGSRPALFSFNKTKSAGAVDIDWVRVDHQPVNP